MVQDVTTDIAIKMSNEGIFLTRQYAKEVLFIKMNKELPRYTYKRLFEDKSKIRFRNDEIFKACMLLIYDYDNLIEYHEIRDQRFFKSNLSDYYSFLIRIASLYAFPNRKGRNVNYRTNGYIQHNHTKEALERNKAELEKSNKVKMEDRKAELRNELDKSIKAPKTRILEYHTRVKNIEDKIKRKEEQLLHVDDEPIIHI